MKPTAPLPEPDVSDMGPAMQALDVRQRQFVAAYVRDARNATKCAAVAGYSPGNGLKVTAHRLLHAPKIIAAIKEEADRNLNSNAYVAAAGLAEIAANPEHRDRYRACADILDRTGFPRTTQHAVSVEHEYTNLSTAELMRLVAQYSAERQPLIEGAIVQESANDDG